MNCPKCGKPSIRTCRCPRRDSTCGDGHEWHTCVVHNVVVDGPSDHSGDTHRCTCIHKATNAEMDKNAFKVNIESALVEARENHSKEEVADWLEGLLRSWHYGARVTASTM